MDAIDRVVLECLVQDGRATYAEIGERVNLSAPAVKRRVDRLRSDGVLRGFTAIVDPGAVGWDTEAIVEVYCGGTISPADLQRHLQTIPEVVSACTVSGGADAVVHLVASDVQHLERALGAVRSIRQVDQTRSSIVLSWLVDRSRPLPEE